MAALTAAIRVWIDMHRSGWHLVEATEGRFRVRYPDGKRSKRFHYASARTYAELFGGAIVHDATGRKVTMGLFKTWALVVAGVAIGVWLGLNYPPF